MPAVQSSFRTFRRSSRGYSLMPSAKQTQERAEEQLFDQITIDGKTIDLRGASIPVQRVRLDPQNPRLLNTVLGSAQPPVEKELQNFLEETLWADPNVRDLSRQIRANKGLTEKILVTQENV